MDQVGTASMRGCALQYNFDLYIYCQLSILSHYDAGRCHSTGNTEKSVKAKGADEPFPDSSATVDAPVFEMSGG